MDKALTAGTWSRRTRTVLSWALFALIVGLLLLQVPLGATAIGRIAVRALAPDGLSIHVGRVGAFPLSSLDLYRVSITDDSGGHVFTAEHVEIDHSFLLALTGRLSIAAIEIDHGTLTLQDRPGGAWGILPARSGSTEPEHASASDGSRPPLPIGRFVLRDSRVEVLRPGSGARGESWTDSTLVLDRLDGRADDLELGRDVGIRGTLRRIGARARLGIAPQEYAVGLDAPGGTLTGAAVTLDTLTADGADSRVTGQLAVDWSAVSRGAPATMVGAFATGALSPVDISAFAPAWRGQTPIAIHTKVAGPLDSLVLELEAAAGQGTAGGEVVVLARNGERGLAWSLEMQDVDPRVLIGPDGSAGRLTGESRSEVVGERPQHWTGTIHADLRTSRLADLDLPRAALSLDMIDGHGQGHLDLALSGPSGRTDFSGRISTRPFDSLPAYQLSGRFAQDIERDGRETVTVRALLDADVRGTGPETLALQATARTDPELPTRVGRSTLVATAQLAMESGAGNWRFEASAGEGSLAAEGRVELTPSSTILEATDVLWRSLDVAALLDDTLASRASGRGSGTLRLQPDGPPASAGRLTLGELQYGQVRVDSASARWSMDRGLLTSSLVAWADSGIARLEVEGTPLGDIPELRLVSGTLSDLDVAAVLVSSDSATVHTALDAQLSGQWRADRTTTGTGTLAWTLAPSTIQARDSVTSSGTIELADGRIRLEGQADAGGATFRSTATLDIVEDPLSWRLDLGFDGLGPADIGQAPGERATVLGGSIAGDGRGLSPETMQGSFALSLDRSLVAGRQVERAEADLVYDGGRVDLELSVAGDSLTLDGFGTVSLAGDSTSYDVTLRGGADRGTPTSLEARVAGIGLDPATADARITVVLDSLTVAGTTLTEGRVDLSAAAGEVRVDTFFVRGPSVDLTAVGRVGLIEGLPSDLQARLALSSLELLRPVVDARPLSIGRGSAELTVVGPVDSARVSFSAEANAVLYGSLQLLGFESEASGLLDGSVPSKGTASLSLAGLSTPNAAVERTDVALSYEGGDIVLDVQSVLDSRRTLLLGARLDPRLEARRILLERVDASVDDDSWTLVSPAELRYGEGLLLDSLELRANDQRVFAAGAITPTGDQDLRVAVEGFRIGTISDLVGWTGLDGSISGGLEIAGTTVAPELTARYDMALEVDGRASVDVEGVTEYRAGQLEIEAAAAQASGGSFDVRGVVPARVSLPWSADTTRALLAVGDGPVEITLDADSLGLAWLRPFLDPAGYQNLAGAVAADVSVTGTAAAPRLEGSARLWDGALDVPALGTRWSAITATASLADDRLQLTELRLDSGEGSLEASGTIGMERLTLGEFDIELTAREFRAVSNDLARAVVSGEGRLTGTTVRPNVAGNVRMLSTDVFLGRLPVANDTRDVELTEEDYEQLQAVFGRDYRARARAPEAPLDSLDLDLGVTLGRDTWIRQAANPEMALQMDGEVRLTKERAQDVRMLGEIRAIPQRSYIEQFGRRFRLTEGRVDFRGAPLDTQIDVRGAYRVPSARNPDQAEVTIQLAIEGTPERVNVVLDSDPDMDNADIVSYLATGRPASRDLDLGTQEGRGLTGVGTGLAVGAVANAIESAAAEQVGLDVIDIETDGLQGATLVAGRYVSPTLFVGFRQPLTVGSSSDQARSNQVGSEVELELQALRWLLLNLQAGGRGFEFLLRSRVAY